MFMMQYVGELFTYPASVSVKYYRTKKNVVTAIIILPDILLPAMLDEFLIYPLNVCSEFRVTVSMS